MSLNLHLSTGLFLSLHPVKPSSLIFLFFFFWLTSRGAKKDPDFVVVARRVMQEWGKKVSQFRLFLCLRIHVPTEQRTPGDRETVVLLLLMVFFSSSSSCSCFVGSSGRSFLASSHVLCLVIQSLLLRETTVIPHHWLVLQNRLFRPWSFESRLLL